MFSIHHRHFILQIHSYSSVVSEYDFQNARVISSVEQRRFDIIVVSNDTMFLLLLQPEMHGNLPVRYTCAMIIIAYIVLNSLREVLQLYQQRWHYLLDPINLVSWLLYICSIIMIMPVFADQLTKLQLSCASITVFLSWFNLLLYLQR